MAGSVIANLKIMLSASWSKLKSDFDKARKVVQSATSQMQSGFATATGILSSYGGAAGVAISQSLGLGASLAALGPIALAVAAAVGVLLGSAAFAGWGVSLAAETESAQVAMQTMLGSAEHAAAVLQEIKRFAAETPFEKGELIQAGKQLAAFGFQAGDVVPTLRMLGDVSALIGAPIEEMAELFGKAKVQGRLFMEDINQFQGRGVPIMQALADVMGVTTGEIRDMVADGKVGFNELHQAFASLTNEGGQFHGGMIAQSETLSGLWGTLKDSFAELAEELGQELLPLLKEAAKFALGMMEGIIGAVKNAKSLLGFEAQDYSDTIKNLPKEDFSGPTEGLNAAQEALKDGTKEIKRNALDVEKIAREVQGMQQAASVGAYERRTTAGFSAVQAAQRESHRQEQMIVEIGRRILEAMEEQTLALKNSSTTVVRRRV